MIMTREEAIELLKYRRNIISNVDADWNANEIEAINFALSALRPVSRERVELVWKGEWNYSHTTETDHFAVVKCSKCEHEAFAIALYVKDGNFCPACGAPMTDEAVDIMLKRMEVLLND